MTDMPFLDHRAIQELAERTPKLRAILAQREIFDAIDPITPAIVPDDAPRETKGYFATIDGRPILRMVTQEESQEIFGKDAATLGETFLLADRLSRIGEIEQAAVDAQARAVRLHKALVLVWEAYQKGEQLGRKDSQKISTLLFTIKKEDEEKAAQIAEMRERSLAARRARDWAMRQVGVTA